MKCVNVFSFIIFFLFVIHLFGVAWAETITATAEDEEEEETKGRSSSVGVLEGRRRLCSVNDLAISHGQTAPLPSGIPTYTVNVINVSPSGFLISNIHMRCGWFSSARLINPSIFRRLAYNDCIVNDGLPIRPGNTVSFQYANTFRSPMSVSQLTCSIP